VIWHVADHWNLTTGVRFTHDERDFSWYNPTRTATALDTGLATYAGVGFPLPPFPYTQNIEFNTPISTAAPLRQNNSWSDTSPRVVLDYKPLQNVMFYASAARGYEAGGYNALEPGAKYDPETVRNYELGVKSEILDRRLLLNASVYYYVYSNLQSLNLVSNGNGALPAYEVTISDQHAKGVDFEARWQATSALRLNFLAAYIDDTYKDYVAPDGTNLSGQATGEPLWSLAAGIDYAWHDVVGGDLDFSLQDAYRGAARCNADSAAQGSCLSIPTFEIGTAENRTDARLGWTSHGAVPVSVALYGNNLFDKQYATGVQLISASTIGTPFSNITAPRFYGVEIGVHF
jgi:iron complex outermembrane receptor protein